MKTGLVCESEQDKWRKRSTLRVWPYESLYGLSSLFNFLKSLLSLLSFTSIFIDNLCMQ